MIFIYLGIFSLFVFNTAFAVVHTDINTLITRAPGKDIYIREISWGTLKQSAENKRNSKLGSTFQVSFFYQSIQNPKDIGSYFGVKGKSGGIVFKQSRENTDINSSTILHDAIYDGYVFNQNFGLKLSNNQSTANDYFIYKKPSDKFPDGAVYILDVDTNGKPIFNSSSNQYKILQVTSGQDTEGPIVMSGDANTDANNRASNITFALSNFDQTDAPKRALRGSLGIKLEREMFGALFSYYLFTPNNFWMEVSLPILYTKQGLTLNIEFEKPSIDPRLKRTVSIDQILKGSFEELESSTNVDNPNKQEKLKVNKFTSELFKEGSVGDLDILMGYRLFDSEKADFDIYLKCALPFAKKIDPTFLFPPQFGSNGHLMIGSGVRGGVDVLNIANMLCDLLFDAGLTYAIPNKQQRVPGAYTDSSVILPWDRYNLVAKVNSAGPMQPFANIALNDVNVYPGFSVETFLSLRCQYKNFIASIGHSLFIKQAENIKIQSWINDSQFGRPSTSRYRSDQTFDPASFPFGEIDNSSISLNELQTTSCSTPGSLTNLIFAHISYQYCVKDLGIFSSGLGMSYEFVKENSAISNLTFWGNLGFAF